jgi:hypothetical protein
LAPPVSNWALSDAAQTALARQVRQFHDLTAGSDLAGSANVVCRRDLAPGNTVNRSTAAGLVPVTFLAQHRHPDLLLLAVPRLSLRGFPEA